MLHVSMERRGQVCRGFTIIELIVVVGIIALLIAILIPAVGSARETAKTALCQSNMRQMGQMIMDFANSHDGRGPGQDTHVVGTPATDALFWWQVVNAEVVGRGQINWNHDANNPSTPYAIGAGQGSISTTSSKALSCPKFQVLGNNYPFAINWDLIGGNSVKSSSLPPCGVFGRYADPKMGANNDYNFDRYSLGGKLTSFRSNQFMIVECETANGARTDDPFSGFSNYESGTGHVTLGTISSLPLYNGVASDPFPPYFYSNRGSASFRHPYFRRGNFLLMDGHVESLTPNDDILSPRRFGLGSSN
jgi:prepilin-type N-terminal cleavage/methylation domain-containing protein/prepilin-type processing-associated H-X9-DG protein